MQRWLQRHVIRWHRILVSQIQNDEKSGHFFHFCSEAMVNNGQQYDDALKLTFEHSSRARLWDTSHCTPTAGLKSG